MGISDLVKLNRINYLYGSKKDLYNKYDVNIFLLELLNLFIFLILYLVDI